MKIASWNVNSLKVRLPQVLTWLKENSPDILALQELKMSDDFFPTEAINAIGYEVCFTGQKTYNGVAILSQNPPINVEKQLPHFLDEQKRMIAATIGDIRVINVYVPNGQSIDSEKYHYKLAWLEAFKTYLATTLSSYTNVVVLGDFNIAPADKDVHDPARWADSVLVSPRERLAWKNLLALGLYDSFRLFDQSTGIYSWWDYRQFAFKRNFGLRIDHILINAPLKQQCTKSYIDKMMRAQEKPSDHAPVICEFQPF